jgi:hypothetical protein
MTLALGMRFSRSRGARARRSDEGREEREERSGGRADELSGRHEVPCPTGELCRRRTAAQCGPLDQVIPWEGKGEGGDRGANAPARGLARDLASDRLGAVPLSALQLTGDVQSLAAAFVPRSLAAHAQPSA